MMTWYQILSFFFTNGLRIFLGLYLVITLQQLAGNRKKASVISVCAAAFITVLSCFPIQKFYLTGNRNNFCNTDCILSIRGTAQGEPVSHFLL